MLGLSVPVADGPWLRLVGLAFLRPERAGPGLFLPRCRCIHTFGVRFPLTVVFLDDDGRVVSRRASVPPGRFVFDRRGRSVLELRDIRAARRG